MGDSSLVFSTESCATCPECEKTIDECSCNPSSKVSFDLFEMFIYKLSYF